MGLYLFGGRLRTGGAGEYGVAWGNCVAMRDTRFNHAYRDGLVSVLYNWAGLYESGVIDGAEWKANRFRFL